jgi:hypothetical protein
MQCVPIFKTIAFKAGWQDDTLPLNTLPNHLSMIHIRLLLAIGQYMSSMTFWGDQMIPVTIGTGIHSDSSMVFPVYPWVS